MDGKLYYDLIDSIGRLVDHKNRQIDENRKISKRIDELEDELDELKAFIVDEFSCEYELMSETRTEIKCPKCDCEIKIIVKHQ